MNYIEFSETNDWEGETWHYFLPLEGNEKALRQLDSKILEYGMNAYSIDWTPRNEGYVMGLVRRKGSTLILKEFNIVQGKLFTLPEFDSHSDLDAILYKGGIENFFT